MSHAKVAFALVVIGLLGIAGWRFTEPYMKANTQAEITDAASLRGNVTIAIDGWAGYFPLCSPEMKKRLRRDGYGLQCIDDAADYQQRFDKLDDNAYDFAVATIDSYVLNGAKFNYPGAIVAVIDESNGGDAIVARRTAVASLEALKSAANIRVAFTPDSPSHHLLKSVASHFDIPAFRTSSSHLHASGSADALRALTVGAADVAVLWEPEVSHALANEQFVRLLGTEDTQQLIVDILLASRRVASNEGELVKTLLKNYFQTLKFYREDEAALVAAMAKYVDLQQTQVAPLLAGVKWATLSENAHKWYSVAEGGFAEEALARAIDAAVDILIDNGDFTEHPLPNRDPYRLLNRQYITQLYRLFGSGGGWRQAMDETRQFTPLSDAQWDRLEAIGSLKARKISFASGTSALTDEGRGKIDELVKDLTHYPAFRVEVRGHTGVRGDPEVNLALSRERAQTVLSYLLETHEVEKNRVRARGFGGSLPLPKRSNESNRAYAYRLPRVELVLVRETL